ncbi:M48 family metallopeptidase [Priestia megaterium]|uniref:M48 family metallopeptidase n=1 Tax=Priestia megaterium TaxID=1404 RepID=UPI0021AD03E5|nr:SprT family zinc-dependent metalloprotease [Priestia megaterium]MCR8927509.1 M48 family metallopeptidase [Priestia megaterium]
MSKHQIQYGNTVIEYELERKKVKNVNLNIKPDMTISVSANEKVPEKFISNFVKEKAPWIVKQLKQFENVQSYKQSEREYVSGESFKYLGKQYRLRVEKTEGADTVKYFRGFIYLSVKDPSNLKNKAKLINNWYRMSAEKVFNSSLNKIYPIIKKYGVEKPKLDLRVMKARWGSNLLESNTVLLNTELIKAPKHCIDYVVLHELIHFKYNDHSEDFYKMLYALMPDWEKRKAILDKEIVRHL